ncbi:MAG: D-alanyl-alanine synthetase [Inquilinus sp.]|nr:D-alanyl-alanine synthetase [Inquilinus sp.]
MDALRLDDSALHLEYADHPFAADEQFADIGDLPARVERALPRLRMALVYGGDKSADGAVLHPTVNRRPWKSYKAVAEDIAGALERLGVGEVHLVADDMHLGENLQRHNIHMAWLNTGGVQGFNSVSHASAMLEMMGVPYVGHNPLTAATLDSKDAFKRYLVALGIPTTPFMTWNLERGPFVPEMNARFFGTFGHFRGPFVVKPVSGRASLHVHVVDDVSGLTDKVTEVFEATENDVLIEPYLEGREFCVSVCGSVVARNRELVRLADPFVLSAVERVLEPNERIFTSMDKKPITNDRVRTLDPEIDSAEIARLRGLAREVFVEFGLNTLVRIDIRADAAGRMCILETNPKPDLKRPGDNITSLVCTELKQHGMDYDDLILSLLADRLDLLLGPQNRMPQHLLELVG